MDIEVDVYPDAVYSWLGYANVSTSGASREVEFDVPEGSGSADRYTIYWNGSCVLQSLIAPDGTDILGLDLQTVYDYFDWGFSYVSFTPVNLASRYGLDVVGTWRMAMEVVDESTPPLIVPDGVRVSLHSYAYYSTEISLEVGESYTLDMPTVEGWYSSGFDYVQVATSASQVDVSNALLERSSSTYSNWIPYNQTIHIINTGDELLTFYIYYPINMYKPLDFEGEHGNLAFTLDSSTFEGSYISNSRALDIRSTSPMNSTVLMAPNGEHASELYCISGDAYYTPGAIHGVYKASFNPNYAWNALRSDMYGTWILVNSSLLEHNLIASLQAPFFLKPGGSCLLNATVYNIGIYTETDVSVSLLIDGETIESATIPELVNGTSSTFSWPWSPPSEGTYNVSLFVEPVAGENFITSNLDTIFLDVSNTPHHVGDIVVEGNEIFVIEDVYFTQTGGIYVRDNASLVLRNATLNLAQTSSYQYEIYVSGSSALISQDSFIVSNYWFQTWITGSSKAWLNTTYIGYSSSNPPTSTLGYVYSQDNAECTVYDSTLGYLYCQDGSNTQVYNSTLRGVYCYGNSEITVINSEITSTYGISTSSTSKSVIINSRIGQCRLNFYSYSIAHLTDLRTGYIGFWNIHTNETVTGVNWNLTLVKSEITSGWSISSFSYSNVTIHHSTLYYVYCYDYSDISIHNSSIYSLYPYYDSTVTVSDSHVRRLYCNYYDGIISFNDTTIEDYWRSYRADYRVQGSLTYTGTSPQFDDGTITRNYIVKVTHEDSPAADVGLTLTSGGGETIWSGTSDDSGEASFDLTFTDDNFTATCTLKPEDASTETSVSLTTETPINISVQLTPETPPDWSVSLGVVVGGYGANLTIGVNTDATGLFDLDHDAIATPAPPTGISAYLYYPDNPPYQGTIDTTKLSDSYHPATYPTSWTLKIETLGGTSGAGTITWNSSGVAEVPENCSVLLVTPSGTVDMRSGDSTHVWEAEADTLYTFTIVVTSEVEFTLLLKAGWNMVSLPVIPGDASAESVLAGVGFYQLITWSGTSYMSASSFEAGMGYWLLVLQDVNVTVSGQPVSSVTLDMPPGWNMVGGPNSVVAKPSEIYQLVTWSGSGYVPMTSFEPTKGYWALVFEAMQLTLP